jgi:hypothetical protein
VRPRVLALRRRVGPADRVDLDCVRRRDDADRERDDPRTCVRRRLDEALFDRLPVAPRERDRELPRVRRPPRDSTSPA